MGWSKEEDDELLEGLDGALLQRAHELTVLVLLHVVLALLPRLAPSWDGFGLLARTPQSG